MYDIRSRRQELGLTLEEVGKMVGVGKSTVRKWEEGMIENMRRDKISLLASALQISPLLLIKDDVPEQNTIQSEIGRKFAKLDTNRQKQVLAYVENLYSTQVMEERVKQQQAYRVAENNRYNNENRNNENYYYR